MPIQFGTKVPGVTARQLFAFQLKTVKPKLKPLWKAFCNRGDSEAEWTRSLVDLYEVIVALVSLFHDASASVQGKRSRDSETEFQKLMNVLKGEEDTCLDVIKCIGVYYYIESIGLSAKPQSLTSELTATLTLMIDALFNSAPAEKLAVTDTKTSLEGSSVDEDNEEIVQTGSRAVNNDQYVTDVISAAAELLKNANEYSSIDDLNKESVKASLSFTINFVEGTLQNVLVLFANRKKLYSLICSTLLSPALNLFNGQSSSSVSDLHQSLRSAVSESLDLGLLDDKHTDDLATIYLPGSEELNAFSANKNKKQKTLPISNIEDAAVNPAVKVVKYNPSFLEGLFQRLGEYYYSSGGGGGADVVHWNRKADAISQLLLIYASKSHAKAVAAKLQSESKSAVVVSTDDGSVSLDVVNLRKHLQRVLHFAFLLVEFLKRKPRDESVTSSGAASAEPGKRKVEMVDPNSSGSELSGLDLIQYQILRSHVLGSLCSLLEGQAILNHDSLAVYQMRLQLLARQSCSAVARCRQEVLQLIGQSEVNHDMVAQQYHTIALELDCYRIVATIDQTSVMEDLKGSVQLLLDDVSLIVDNAPVAKPASKKKTSNKSEVPLSASSSYVSWQWHLHHHASQSVNSLYQKLLQLSGEKSSQVRCPALAVSEAHDPLTVDCLRHYEGNIEPFLPLIVEILPSFESLNEAQRMQYFALLRIYHSKQLLCHLFVAIHSQLRTMTDFVGELSSQEAEIDVNSQSLMSALIVSPTCQSLLVKAFLIIPTGQVSLMWDALAKSSNSVGLGIVRCSVLQCFVRSIERTVRSSSQLYSLHGVSMEAANEDPLLPSMVTLLSLHCDTLKPLPGDSESSVVFARTLLIRAALGSLASLVCFATQYFSSAVSQLLLPVTLNDESTISFHEMTTNKVFDCISETSRESLTVCELLNAILSVILLQSNVSAKAVNHRLVSTDRDSVRAQLERLITPFVSCLSDLRNEDTSVVLSVLLLLLNNTHIWLQFTEEPSSIIKSQHVLPLFVQFVDASLTRQETDSYSYVVVLEAIQQVLASASQVDSPFIQSILHEAVDSVWSGITKEKSKTARFLKECQWVVAVIVILPKSSVDKVVPRLFSHLLKALQQSEPNTASDESIEACVALLLKYVCSAGLEIEDSDTFSARQVQAVVHMVSDEMTAVTSSTAKGKMKKPAAATASENASLVTSMLLVKALNTVDYSKTYARDVLRLATIVVDRWICHLIGSDSEGLKTVLDAVAEVATNHEVTSSLRVNLMHSVSSRLYEKLSNKDELPSSTEVLKFTERFTKRKFSAIDASDCDCFCLADALFLHRSLSTSNEEGFDQALNLLSSQRPSTNESAEGWLYLSSVLSKEWISSANVVFVKSLPGDSRSVVRVDLGKAAELCSFVLASVEQHIHYQAASADTVEVSLYASWAVTEMLQDLVKMVVTAGMCDCDASDVFQVIHKNVVVPLITASDIALDIRVKRLSAQYASALSKDLLFSLLQLTESTDGKVKDKLTSVVENSLRMTKLTLEKLITSQPVLSCYSDAEVLLSILTHIQDITLTLDATGVATTKGKKRKAPDGDENEEISDGEDDNESAALSRLRLWSAGLTHMMSSVSHKLSFVSLIDSNLDSEAVQALLIRSLGLVDVIKRVLSCMVGIVTHSSLTHLSSSLAAFIQLLCRLIHILIRIENSLSEEGNSAAVFSSIKVYSGGVEVIQEHLIQCYNLVTKTLSNVASSRDLQKDATLVAAVVVDQLTKLRLSKAVKDNLFPGLYALFEKCDLKLKNQMFRQLDVQARALMTDIHDEYMRSFKFIGK